MSEKVVVGVNVCTNCGGKVIGKENNVRVKKSNQIDLFNEMREI